MIQTFRFLEHVFAEQAFEHAGRSNRAEQMEMFGANALGKLHGIARALHVDLELAFGIGGKVINGRQMEKVGGLFTQFFTVDRSNPQAGLGQVASNGKHPGFFCRGEIPEFIKRIQRIQLSGTNQKIDCAAFARQ